MGSPAILYCGSDDCLRTAVLRASGFRVARCASLEDLERRLPDIAGIAALVFEEELGRSADATAARLRLRSRAALVLFQHPAGDCNEATFDLVIAPATPPARWLDRLTETLMSRIGFAEATPRWAQIAKELRAGQRDLPAPVDRPGLRYRIQPEKRRCT